MRVALIGVYFRKKWHFHLRALASGCIRPCLRKTTVSLWPMPWPCLLAERKKPAAARFLRMRTCCIHRYAALKPCFCGLNGRAASFWAVLQAMGKGSSSWPLNGTSLDVHLVQMQEADGWKWTQVLLGLQPRACQKERGSIPPPPTLRAIGSRLPMRPNCDCSIDLKRVASDTPGIACSWRWQFAHKKTGSRPVWKKGWVVKAMHQQGVCMP